MNINGSPDSIETANPQSIFADAISSCSNDYTERGTRGIDEATLDSYPKMLYSRNNVRSSKSVEEEDLEVEDKTCCSICLSDYRESEEVRVMLDCGHMFHVFLHVLSINPIGRKKHMNVDRLERNCLSENSK